MTSFMVIGMIRLFPSSDSKASAIKIVVKLLLVVWPLLFPRNVSIRRLAFSFKSVPFKMING